MGCGYTGAMNTLNRKIIAVALAGLVTAGVVGCGNKGPLVLPQRPAVDSAPVDVEEAEADEATVEDEATVDETSDGR